MAVNAYSQELLFANNAQTTLAGSINNITTTITVASGGGALFPNPAPGQGVPCTLTDTATGLLREVVLMTARTGDTLIVERAQEGTTGLSWTANDLFAQLVTAGGLTTFLQASQAQAQASNYAVDTGSVNSYIVGMLPVITSVIEGTPLRVLIDNDNTGSSTLDYGAGAVPIYRRDGSALIGGELLSGQVAEFIVQGSNVQLMGIQPTTASAVTVGTDNNSAVTPLRLAAALSAVASAPSGTGPLPFSGRTAPSGWLLCNGTAVSRATYAALFAAITETATVTITIASPGVVTWNSHPLVIGDVVSFETTGALPTNLAVGTNYYVITAGFAANTFQVSATPGGAAVNTAGSQSGVQTCRLNPYGCGNGTSTFTLPDARGRTIVGSDTMGTSAAGRLTSASMLPNGEALGATGGVEAKTFAGTGSTGAANGNVGSAGNQGSASAFSVDAHVHTSVTITTTSASILQPSLTANMIIKT